jgi:hypothetical protein
MISNAVLVVLYLVSIASASRTAEELSRLWLSGHYDSVCRDFRGGRVFEISAADTDGVDKYRDACTLIRGDNGGSFKDPANVYVSLAAEVSPNVKSKMDLLNELSHFSLDVQYVAWKGSVTANNGVFRKLAFEHALVANNRTSYEVFELVVRNGDIDKAEFFLSRRNFRLDSKVSKQLCIHSINAGHTEILDLLLLDAISSRIFKPDEYDDLVKKVIENSNEEMLDYFRRIRYLRPSVDRMHQLLVFAFEKNVNAFRLMFNDQNVQFTAQSLFEYCSNLTHWKGLSSILMDHFLTNLSAYNLKVNLALAEPKALAVAIATSNKVLVGKYYDKIQQGLSKPKFIDLISVKQALLIAIKRRDLAIIEDLFTKVPDLDLTFDDFMLYKIVANKVIDNKDEWWNIWVFICHKLHPGQLIKLNKSFKKN